MSYKYLSLFSNQDPVTVFFENEIAFFEDIAQTSGTLTVSNDDASIHYDFTVFLWIDNDAVMRWEIEAQDPLNDEGDSLTNEEIDDFFNKINGLNRFDFERDFDTYVSKCINENKSQLKPWLILLTLGIPYDTSAEELYKKLETKTYYEYEWLMMRAWLGDDTDIKLMRSMVFTDEQQKQKIVDWLNEKIKEVI